MAKPSQSSLPAPPKASSGPPVAVEVVVADAAVEPVDVAVADDVVALRRADDVLEALQGVVPVAFRAGRMARSTITPPRVALA